MKQHLHTALSKIMHAEPSTHRFTASCCTGIFLACSPFLGIQILLAFLLSALFHLNSAVVIIVLCLVNNPFTMIPIIMVDYLAGYVIIERIFGLDLSTWVPTWLSWFDNFIRTKLTKMIPSMHFSITYYLIGGIIFALICSIIAYPLLYALVNRLHGAYTKNSPPKQ